MEHARNDRRICRFDDPVCGSAEYNRSIAGDGMHGGSARQNSNRERPYRILGLRNYGGPLRSEVELHKAMTMTITKILSILCLSAFAAFAQNIAVTVRATSPTQAVLAWTAPDNSACTVEVSESGTYSPLVHDVDGSLFAGANLDNRAGAIDAPGNLRIFVAGTRIIQAAGPNKYSRALQQNKVHHYRVNCGSQVGTGTFTTKILPFGATYQDLLPLNADGTYNWPTVTGVRNQHIIDSQTGVLMNVVNVQADNVGGEAPFPESGGFTTYCNNVLTAQGNWLCTSADFPSGVFSSLYSINAATGAAAYLGYASFYPSRIDPNGESLVGISNGIGVMWDTASANVAYRNYTVVANSYTSVSIPTTLPATVSLTTVQMQLSYLTPGRRITVFADIPDSMTGTVTSYNPNTGSLVLNVTGTTGSGTFAGWSLPYRNTAAKFTYTGNDIPVAGGMQAAYTVVDMLGSTIGVPGANLTDLAAAFNSNFDPSVYQNCRFTTFQTHYLLFACYRNDSNTQNSYGWVGAYDVGNALPLGSGGNGHIVAMTTTYANQGSRWCGNHTNDYLGDVPVLSFATSQLDDQAIGQGPYLTTLSANLPAASSAVATTGTLNGTTSVTVANGSGISTGMYVYGYGVTFGTTVAGISGNSITLSSAAVASQSGVPLTFGVLTTVGVGSTWNAAWGTPPAAYQAGEPVSLYADHFLQTAQPGDIFQMDNENIMLYTKISPTLWGVMRGIIGSYTGVGAISHLSGATLTATCQSSNNVVTSSGGYLWWDFVNSPDGSIQQDFRLNFGAHPVSRGNYAFDSSDYVFRPGSLTDKSLWGTAPPDQISTITSFSGKLASGAGNSFQKHPSMASSGGTTAFDQTYWVGTSLYSAQNSSATTPVTGTLYQYNDSTGVNTSYGIFLAPKFLPTVVKTHGRSLVDVSGPGSVITGTTADNWHYCIAYLANECVTGSRAGAIYFNHPTLSPSSPWCSGGENGVAAEDICIGNFWPGGIAAMQFLLVNDPTGGLSYRPLTRTFENFESASTSPTSNNTLADNLKLTYDGNWALLFLVNTGNYSNPSSTIFDINVPPIPPSDGIDRTNFVRAVVSVPAPTLSGIVSARIKFGYAEQGSIGNYFCTSRRESCVAVASTIDQANPFSYISADSYTPTPCAIGCTISIPVCPLHTAYYSIEYLDSQGGVVTTADGIAMENSVVTGSAAGANIRRPVISRGTVDFRGAVRTN
jgi:hypothetical protein